jgi:pimeloyl-ACP methyl ester carboxylesterase
MLHKLVILNAPHPTVLARELLNNPAQQKASAYFNVFNSPTAEPLLSQDDFAILRRAVFAGSWANDDDLRKYLECWRRGLTGGLNYYRAAGLKSPIGGEESEPSQFLTPRNPITVPTLVIWGERDIALLTGNLDGLDQHVKNLKIQRLPEAGHFVVHEQSAVVIRSMRQFLQEA